nr:substrate-binding domain-containing protein [Paraoerskovia marina]
MIALAFPELTEPYFAELASHLVRAAKKRGLSAIVSQTDGLAETERAVADGTDMPLVDGLILSPLALGAADLAERTDKGPLVLLGETVRDESPYPRVAIDNHQAAVEATLHLAGLGRRRIAAIGARATAPRATAVLRLEGYRAGLAAAGLSYDSDLVGYVPGFHRCDGEQAMFDLLQRDPRPDAVFCFNDSLALGALRALRESGLSVPDDVAIIGIDDIEEGRFSAPALSTIAPDKSAIADAAISLLLDRADDPNSAPREVTVGFELVARGSTSCPSPAPTPLPVTTRPSNREFDDDSPDTAGLGLPKSPEA